MMIIVQVEIAPQVALVLQWEREPSTSQTKGGPPNQVPGRRVRPACYEPMRSRANPLFFRAALFRIPQVLRVEIRSRGRSGAGSYGTVHSGWEEASTRCARLTAES